MKTPTARTSTALTNKKVAKEIWENITVKNWLRCQEFKIYKIYKDSINFYNYVLQNITMYDIVILKKGENIKQTKNYAAFTYETKNNFRVDIIITNDTYEAWIYKKDMGVKELMFRIPKENNHLWQMEELVEKNLEEYMIDYEMSYCYE